MTEIDEIIVELDRVYKMTTENKAWLRGRLENLARVNKRLADPVVDARNDPPEMPREDINIRLQIQAEANA